MLNRLFVMALAIHLLALAGQSKAQDIDPKGGDLAEIAKLVKEMAADTKAIKKSVERLEKAADETNTRLTTLEGRVKRLEERPVTVVRTSTLSPARALIRPHCGCVDRGLPYNTCGRWTAAYCAPYTTNYPYYGYWAGW